MNDIDEPEDVTFLCQRLSASASASASSQRIPADEQTKDVLMKSSTGSGEPKTAPCQYTIKALEALGLLNPDSDGSKHS
jgi:hypothetical protein